MLIIIDWYKKYIFHGYKLTECIENGIIEWFYLRKTKYCEFLEKYKNQEMAWNMALRQYIKENGMDQYTQMIHKKEMIIRLVL